MTDDMTSYQTNLPATVASKSIVAGSKPPLPDHLSAKLDRLKAWEDFSTLPVLIDSDRDAVEDELRSILPYLAPGDQGLMGITLADLDVLPRKREGDAEAKFKMEVYAKALRSFPLWTVRRAVAEIIETENWFPTPAQIIGRAKTHQGKVLWKKLCLEQWLNQTPSEAPIKPVTAEERAAILVEFGLKSDPVAVAQNQERAAA
jgi:hypothetical protein